MNREILKKGINELGLSIPEKTQRTLLDFLVFLNQWNQVHNLTAITDIKAMVTKHVLDSLSIVPYLPEKRVLDVGSGAGFPGIPLALTCPEKHVILLDSKIKKTVFLLQAAARFKIPNVTVVQMRVEDYHPSNCFSAITCRALGSLARIVDQTQHVLCPEGRWFVMKGTYPKEELPAIVYPTVVYPLTVPGLKAERHLVKIENRRDYCHC